MKISKVQLSAIALLLISLFSLYQSFQLPTTDNPNAPEPPFTLPMLWENEVWFMRVTVFVILFLSVYILLKGRKKK